VEELTASAGVRTDTEEAMEGEEGVGEYGTVKRLSR
jgi:hypothetical protein